MLYKIDIQHTLNPFFNRINTQKKRKKIYFSNYFYLWCKSTSYEDRFHETLCSSGFVASPFGPPSAPPRPCFGHASTGCDRKAVEEPWRRGRGSDETRIKDWMKAWWMKTKQGLNT